ncbi:hypothetical protein [Arthrobacter sp. 35W]|uniref:hypothetical protein n=1 Tax=Arthrobacter sp. 35W TaxID=1132441 RepID=UPI0003FAAFA6|nr:hypothetical protein [Arthrobacter sp. 35W]
MMANHLKTKPKPASANGTDHDRSYEVALPSKGVTVTVSTLAKARALRQIEKGIAALSKPAER